MTHQHGRRLGSSRTALAVALFLAGALGACAGQGSAQQSSRTAGASTTTERHRATSSATGHSTRPATALPSSHVHAVAVNPADNRVYLATHDGLFRYDPSGPRRVGPVIDLMGFTVAGPNHFFASGHPGPGTDLPQPVGLIESTDGGRTWTPLSRLGQSDFHAMTAAGAGVVGYDGTLRASTDGRTWTTLQPPVQPFALAASPDGRTLVATSESGPVRSTDRGDTWARLQRAPLLQYVAWAGADTVVGVTPDGTVAVSTDRASTWTSTARTGGPPQAVGAHLSRGTLRVLVVTAHAVLSSTGGRGYAPL
jgi:photosystem II stability/assembly factor-like uncharacterized protein